MKTFKEIAEYIKTNINDIDMFGITEFEDYYEISLTDDESYEFSDSGKNDIFSFFSQISNLPFIITFNSEEGIYYAINVDENHETGYDTEELVIYSFRKDNDEIEPAFYSVENEIVMKDALSNLSSNFSKVDIFENITTICNGYELIKRLEYKIGLSNIHKIKHIKDNIFKSATDEEKKRMKAYDNGGIEEESDTKDKKHNSVSTTKRKITIEFEADIPNNIKEKELKELSLFLLPEYDGDGYYPGDYGKGYDILQSTDNSAFKVTIDGYNSVTIKNKDKALAKYYC